MATAASPSCRRWTTWRQLALFQSITGPAMPGGGWTPDHTLNIVTTSQTGTVAMDLDGTPIGSLFAPMPSAPAWYYARMNIPEGMHLLQGPTRFQAQTSGFGSYNSYTYFTGFEEEDIGTGLHPDLHAPALASCIVTSGILRASAGGTGTARVDIIDARGTVVQHTGRACLVGGSGCLHPLARLLHADGKRRDRPDRAAAAVGGGAVKFVREPQNVPIGLSGARVKTVWKQSPTVK